MVQRSLCGFLWLLCTISGLHAQTLLDFSIGTTLQDRFAVQVALHQQFSPAFRAGLEVQYGAVQYRFIEARPINEGYATQFSIPLTLRLAQQKNIQLYGTFKTGIRLQGIIDPDNNDVRDSILNSTAWINELGFLVNFRLSERLDLQSGVSFPVGFELAPSALFEYQWTNIHAGLSYQLDPFVLWVRGTAGPSFGAEGDTYKFMWGLQVGLRWMLGPQTHNAARFIATSF